MSRLTQISIPYPREISTRRWQLQCHRRTFRPLPRRCSSPVRSKSTTALPARRPVWQAWSNCGECLAPSLCYWFFRRFSLNDGRGYCILRQLEHRRAPEKRRVSTAMWQYRDGRTRHARQWLDKDYKRFRTTSNQFCDVQYQCQHEPECKSHNRCSDRHTHEL